MGISGGNSKERAGQPGEKALGRQPFTREIQTSEIHDVIPFPTPTD
jgi:hypothetical protein